MLSEALLIFDRTSGNQPTAFALNLLNITTLTKTKSNTDDIEIMKTQPAT